jgi:hypothetical protein
VISGIYSSSYVRSTPVPFAVLIVTRHAMSQTHLDFAISSSRKGLHKAKEVAPPADTVRTPQVNDRLG